MTKNKQRLKQSFPRRFLPLAILPLVLVICLGLWVNLIPDDFAGADGKDGVWNLRGVDLSDTSVHLDGDVAYISGALLTPEEFAAREDEAVVGPTQNVDYLTGLKGSF